jgi:hypothetical protein
VAGRTLFNASCAACHGAEASGTPQGPPLGGLDPAYAARRVRTSGRADSSVYEGLTGGVMPFWAADRLSDDELRDLLAWLRTGGGEVDSGDPPDPTDPPEPSGCASTHPLVGASAVLEGYFHDVSGTAEVVDDCTIELRDFTYDGSGIDVRVYGGLDGDYDQGFAISEDLLRSEGYQRQTLTLRLPPDRTLDDLDGVSIWCVDAAVDFGSGAFTP